MQKCLGIYIEKNLIKYAKVSKDKDDMKVESFGIKFYQNLTEDINKIVQETYSFNTPISINLANETYLYFDIFALLNKKDIEASVKTEFENYCEEKNFNSNAFENRFALMENKIDKEKVRALDISINKIELNRQEDIFKNYKLTTTVPISIAIANIARLNKRENQLIVNMEENTTITTVYDNQIYKIDTIEAGSADVLGEINKQENSYAKAYDICKNTTIYTAESENLGEEQQYLQQIMPTLFKIAEQLQEIIKEDTNKIQTIFLTGTLASINNIDLYFQEFFPDIECKILKPNIVDEAVTKINIKEYVEVNSAIALATADLGNGIKELNFRKLSVLQKIAELLKIEMPGGNKKANLKNDFNTSLSKTEQWIIRGCAILILAIVIFIILSSLLSDQMLKKENEIKALTTQETAEIAKITGDTSSLDSKTDKYKKLTADLEVLRKKLSEKAARRNSIPNLLNQLMANIPDKVQVVQIENTKDRTIVINAQSYYYDQLGIFVGVLKANKILKNVITSSTYKPNGIIYISIEGELP